VADAFGGYLSGLIALVADVAHMLADTGALAMAYAAARLSLRPADPRRSYGYGRLRVLAALVNSLVLLVLVAWLAVKLLRRSTHILMEGTPDGLESGRLAAQIIESVPGVVDVHHVHAWSLGSKDALLILHARLAPGQDPAEVLPAIKQLLAERHGIKYSTLQREGDRCADAG
jgi:Co/Zn/Cd efflux system component